MATGVPKIEWLNDPSVVLSGQRGKLVDFDRERSRRKGDPAFTRLRSAATGKLESRLYWADNLDVLSSLSNDSSICGKVRLIYIDPPYATNSVFQSKAMKPAYADVLTGERYLLFLRARLELLRGMLADDGSIYVHLDETMVFHAKVMMDEIFGAKNFRSFITRRKCSSKNYTHKTYGDVSDYILFYTKSAQYVWNRPVAPWTDEHADREYPYAEETTERRFKKVPLHAPGVRNGPCGKPWRGMAPPAGRHWKTTPAKLEALDAKGEIYWSSTGNPRKKVYLDESKGVSVSNLWMDCRDAHNQNVKITGYPTEKNETILDRIVRASTNKGDLVLDCFCGSGTTLAAAQALDRRWVGVDNSKDAILTSIKRLAPMAADSLTVLAPATLAADGKDARSLMTAIVSRAKQSPAIKAAKKAPRGLAK